MNKRDKENRVREVAANKLIKDIIDMIIDEVEMIGDYNYANEGRWQITKTDIMELKKRKEVTWGE